MRDEVISLDKHAIIVGAGPCGLSAAIELERVGISCTIIERGNIVDAIYRYPTHQTFFSSATLLEIGDIPFICKDLKPHRQDALVYYREVVSRTGLVVKPFETVESVDRRADKFIVRSRHDRHGVTERLADFVVLATGYYGRPRKLDVPGEELPHVTHYFKEAHPFYRQHVTVIGGKNSAVDAAIELEKAGAYVTVLYRGDGYSPSVKPWVLPAFDSLVRHEKVRLELEAEIIRIEQDHVVYRQHGEEKRVATDHVLAMTGYLPDHGLFSAAGVLVDDETGVPQFDEATYETNVDNLFIAGVVAAGNDANKIFIENGRFHGQAIAEALRERIGVTSS
ncbi:YpdA family putative bacillithiol disulfide reductase [Exiguobacterium sp. SH3S2]|uniref:YpdA family putative bacillithiol disulfide reductase n=1 Tax=unclassified Exiguobacterium TaxID=2644629 RepID=UPI0010395651|nr:MULTISPECIES: YpdA family putative bacillithiol disulfide reductase [unclassified Exiguobacterium]TCI27558.1 YpdA family putative bacillithiol disulfide reductase [Exiguobacterium sp. SH5S4]TCI49300.1 YpdA family putative bacillithiol disulfide reductase [Exiguobacterium sp. SH3S3]TCI57908.1 YpdA family putative bacillithiol disulfide reductase [Exiguobacterium sp. SH5S13]TCI64613.1 YpdA family putative bacillithiol disulfide reductase [Exiguobacterium sp. SH3S2]